MTESGCDSWVGIKGDCRWGSTLLAASYVAQVVVLTKFSDSPIITETKLRTNLIIAIECMACEKILFTMPLPRFGAEFGQGRSRGKYFGTHASFFSGSWNTL